MRTKRRIFIALLVISCCVAGAVCYSIPRESFPCSITLQDQSFLNRVRFYFWHDNIAHRLEQVAKKSKIDWGSLELQIQFVENGNDEWVGYVSEHTVGSGGVKSLYIKYMIYFRKNGEDRLVDKKDEPVPIRM